MTIELIDTEGKAHGFDAQYLIGKLKDNLKDFYAFSVPERESCVKSLDCISRLLGTK